MAERPSCIQIVYICMKLMCAMTMLMHHVPLIHDQDHQLSMNGHVIESEPVPIRAHIIHEGCIICNDDCVTEVTVLNNAKGDQIGHQGQWTRSN